MTNTAKQEEVNRKDLGIHEMMALVMDKSKTEKQGSWWTERRTSNRKQRKGFEVHALPWRHRAHEGSGWRRTLWCPVKLGQRSEEGPPFFQILVPTGVAVPSTGRARGAERPGGRALAFIAIHLDGVVRRHGRIGVHLAQAGCQKTGHVVGLWWHPGGQGWWEVRTGQDVPPEEAPLLRRWRGSVRVLQGGHVKGLGVFFSAAFIVVSDDVLTDVFLLKGQQCSLFLPPEGDEEQHQG